MNLRTECVLFAGFLYLRGIVAENKKKSHEKYAEIEKRMQFMKYINLKRQLICNIIDGYYG